MHGEVSKGHQQLAATVLGEQLERGVVEGVCPALHQLVVAHDPLQQAASDKGSNSQTHLQLIAAQTLHGDHDLHLDLVYKSRHKCNLRHHFHGLAVQTHYGEVLHCLGLGIPLQQLRLLLQHGVVMQQVADWYAHYVAHICSYDFASVNFGSVPPSLRAGLVYLIVWELLLQVGFW